MRKRIFFLTISLFWLISNAYAYDHFYIDKVKGCASITGNSGRVYSTDSQSSQQLEQGDSPYVCLAFKDLQTIEFEAIFKPKHGAVASAKLSYTINNENDAYLTGEGTAHEMAVNITAPLIGNVTTYTIMSEAYYVLGGGDVNGIQLEVKQNNRVNRPANDKWMSNIPNFYSVADLTIPGTHDSGTWNYTNTFTQEWVKTQHNDNNFIRQLNDGIRFFDIRVQRNNGNDAQGGWVLVHGDYYLGVSFDQFLRDAGNWLRNHNTETILVSIKEDKKPSDGNLPTNSEIFNHYQYKFRGVDWYTDNNVPSLGEVRGKMILMNRFSHEPGINLSGWGDNPPDAKLKSIKNMDGFVQDEYKAGGNDKVNAIITFMDRHGSGSNGLNINFTSASTQSCLSEPWRCKDDIMTKLYSNLEINGNGLPKHDYRRAIYPMDFYDMGFVNKLIDSNYFVWSTPSDQVAGRGDTATDWKGITPNEAKMITAVVAWPNNNTYFFLNNGTYLKYSNSEEKVTYRSYTADNWPGITAYDATKITGAEVWPNGYAYFFLNYNKYLRYDINNDKVDYWASTSNVWSGISEDDATKITAVGVWPNGHAYFFLNYNKYLRYDINNDKVDYWASTSNVWSGISEDDATKITAVGVGVWPNGYAYFFLNNGQYIKYKI